MNNKTCYRKSSVGGAILRPVVGDIHSNRRSGNFASPVLHLKFARYHDVEQVVYIPTNPDW